MARWSNIVTLIKVSEPTEYTNESGFSKYPDEQSRSVLCNKKSVGYSEFYKASQAGYKTELKVDIHTQDYDGETIAEFENKRYKILRTYESKCGDFTELTLSDLSERGETIG